jgi:hypothetical protein
MKNTPGYRIQQCWLFVAIDPAGDEGLPTFLAGDAAMPMVATTKKAKRHLQGLVPGVLRGRANQRLEVRRFDSYEVEQTYDAPDQTPAPPTESVSVPFSMWEQGEVVPQDALVVADGEIVYATVVDGQPAIAVQFTVAGKAPLPPIALKGKQAEDLGPLAISAYKAARATVEG